MHDSRWALTSFMHHFPFGITHKGFGHYAVPNLPYVVMLALYLMHLHNCGPQIDTKIAWKSAQMEMLCHEYGVESSLTFRLSCGNTFLSHNNIVVFYVTYPNYTASLCNHRFIEGIIKTKPHMFH